MDFNEIKQRAKIVDVLLKRGISLRYNGEWGSAPCPLPSHKQGDKDRTFQVNTRENYFKCWSASCNEKAGSKGGDVINLVALLDNCSQYEAAKRLADMFHIGTSSHTSELVSNEKKPAPHRETRAEVPKGNGNKPTSQKDSSDYDKSSGKNNGYLHNVGLLLDGILKRGEQEQEEVYLHRGKKAAMTLVKQSYLNGKKEAQGVAQ